MNISPPTTAYVRESYAREKHPDDETLTQLRREGFDAWLSDVKSQAVLDALRIVKELS